MLGALFIIIANIAVFVKQNRKTCFTRRLFAIVCGRWMRQTNVDPIYEKEYTHNHKFGIDF